MKPCAHGANNSCVTETAEDDFTTGPCIQRRVYIAATDSVTSDLTLGICSTTVHAELMLSVSGLLFYETLETGSSGVSVSVAFLL